MKLKNQVVSLELAKKLKELEVEQESLFWWTYAPKDKQDGDWVHVLTYGRKNNLDETISAYTVAELGELLPQGYGSYLTIKKGWSCVLKYPPSTSKTYFARIYATTEADVRAKMLIYLLENNQHTLCQDKKK